MPLSDIKIRTAKPSEGIQKLSDGEGLQLWISPVGGKAWKLAYRFDGKQKKLPLGNYPEISLQKARELRAEAKRWLAEGQDPGEVRRLEKLNASAAAVCTFDVIAGELIERKRKEGKARATLGKLEWLFGIASGTIGSRPISAISAPEILATLRQVESRGKLESANRLRAVIGECFRYAIATGRAQSDPTVALRGALLAPKVQHRAAITEPAEIGALLRAIDGFNGQPTTIAALKLMAYLFPRPGELRHAEWSEFDLDKAVWAIPAPRTKMRREHIVPLPQQALAILKKLHGISGSGRFVFPGYGTSSGFGRKIEKRAISENTLNAALRRMGYSAEEMTSHGFRALASTRLNESGKFSADAIERALAHQDPDPVRRAYARGTFWTERVEMAEWWANYLDDLRDGAKVIEFKPARA